MSDHNYKVHEQVNIEHVGVPTSDDKLTGDSCVLLAFIRDHPGCAYYEIVDQFRMDSNRLRNAIWQLLGHSLIVIRSRPTKHFTEQKWYILASTYYPV